MPTTCGYKNCPSLEHQVNPVRDIRVGDKITVTTTGTVVETYKPDGYGYVRLDNDQSFLNDDLDGDTLQWTRVSRPKPKTGDIVTGKDLVGTPWKRGTMIGTTAYDHPQYVLTASGKWATLNTYSNERPAMYDFSEFDFSDASWKIHYTPDSK